MDEFNKKIKIEFDADTGSINKIQKALDALKKTKLVDDDSIEALSSQFKEYSNATESLKYLQKTLSSLEGLKTEEAEKARAALEEQISEYKKLLLMQNAETGSSSGKSAFGGAIKEKGLNALSSVLDSAISGLKKVFKDAWSELSNVLNYSKLSNANTRELAFTYGFNASQAYGFDQALSVLGLNSEEDLFYLNDQERQQFANAFEKYSSKYEELYDSGFFETLQQYQVEIAEFRQDLKLQVVNFFMENKETIKSALKAIISLAEFTIKALGWLVSFFMKQEATNDDIRAANTTAIIRQYSNSTQQTSVKVDNTFNGVSSTDQTWLANAGEVTYKQVIDALR